MKLASTDVEVQAISDGRRSFLASPTYANTAVLSAQLCVCSFLAVSIESRLLTCLPLGGSKAASVYHPERQATPVPYC